MKVHYIHNYLLNPVHPITVNVIGAGGNGSQVLTQLARIDQSLKMIGHLGLHITCFDDDIVTEANLGRQLFSPVDLGINKAVVLITRLNRFFGTSWNAVPLKFNRNIDIKDRLANITISCVDTIASRKSIAICTVETRKDFQPYEKPLYWMDIGNTQHSGQFIISTVFMDKQPKSEHKTVARLKDIFELFPDLKTQKEDKNTPSCSLVEALTKQDLFINSTLVQLAMGTLWKMFREGKLNYQGAFLNLQTLRISTINL